MTKGKVGVNRYGTEVFEPSSDKRVKFQIDSMVVLGTFSVLKSLSEGLLFSETGTVDLTFVDGTTITQQVYAGQLLPVRVTEVAAGSTGTSITGAGVTILY